MEAEIIGDTFFTMHRLPARNDSVRVAEALSQLKSDHNLHNKTFLDNAVCIPRLIS